MLGVTRGLLQLQGLGTLYSARHPTFRGEVSAFHVKDLAAYGIPTKGQPFVHHAAAGSADNDPASSYDSDLIVVLDLDECLVHSKVLSINKDSPFRSAPDPDPSLYVDDSSQQVDSFQLTLPHKRIQVYKRPFLDYFLWAVCSKYETHLFTAGSQSYADRILDRLVPWSDRFAKRWYDESCELDREFRVYHKNLSLLGLKKPANNLKRVVCVDNNPLSFLANPSNGILVRDFYNDPSDKTLPAVLELLKELEPLDDVRPTLNKRFGLKKKISEIKDGKKQRNKQQWKTL